MNLPNMLEEQFRTYQSIQIQDIYKLIYQGTFGCEHAVDEKSRKKLYKEFKKAKPNKEEKLIEIISPNFFIYRINIRPYKAHGGEKETLFEWFYESSKIKDGTIQNFFESWKTFELLNEQEHYFPTEKIKDFEEMLKKEYSEKLPVMHHSKQYRKANKPSYRVINYMAMHDCMKKYND